MAAQQDLSAGKAAYQSGKLDEAAAWFEKAAEQGNSEAQQMLFDMARDNAEAVRWVRKEAKRGNSEAQFTLAAMYLKGQGVAQDYKQANYWYRKAAGQ